MDSIGTIQPHNGVSPQSEASRQAPNASLVRRLALLMGQATDYFPHQAIPDGTPELWLKAWKELAIRYGEARFTEAVWAVCTRSRFMPLPVDIAEECERMRLRDRERDANPNSHVLDMRDYQRRLRDNPADFVSVAIVAKEAAANVARRREAGLAGRAKGEAVSAKKTAGRIVDLTDRLRLFEDQKTRAAGVSQQAKDDSR